MASGKTLNASNLESLGTPHLAELLLEISANDVAVKRHLRLALADAVGALEVAREVRKRLVTIGKAQSFVDWCRKRALVQDLDRAARLVIDRADELDGNCYWALTPAAQALAGRSPLAATLLLRAMIDFTLAGARASRYKHAVRHLAECGRLAFAIDDFGAFETHTDYGARIRRQHLRKTKFQSLLQVQ